MLRSGDTSILLIHVSYTFSLLNSVNYINIFITSLRVAGMFVSVIGERF